MPQRHRERGKTHGEWGEGTRLMTTDRPEGLSGDIPAGASWGASYSATASEQLLSHSSPVCSGGDGSACAGILASAGHWLFHALVAPLRLCAHQLFPPQLGCLRAELRR